MLAAALKVSGLDGTILDSFSSFGSGRFWSNANLHLCLGIGTNLRGFLGLFLGGPISAIGKVVRKFLWGGEASQVSEDATQNLFSSYSQEVELCHVEVLYQCFASPVKIEECFLFREAVRGFPNFRSRCGLYAQLGNQLHILVIMCPAYHMPSMHVFCCVGSNLFRTCALTCLFFQGIANLCFALSNQMPESQMMTNKKPN